MMKLVIVSLIFSICQGFNLCVVGGNSGLGREIIFQGITANKKILALSNSSDKIQYPYRGGGLDLKSTNTFIDSNNLRVDTYNNFNKYKFENIVFTIGGQPFTFFLISILYELTFSIGNISSSTSRLIDAIGILK